MRSPPRCRNLKTQERLPDYLTERRRLFPSSYKPGASLLEFTNKTVRRLAIFLALVLIFPVARTHSSTHKCWIMVVSGGAWWPSVESKLNRASLNKIKLFQWYSAKTATITR